MDVEPGSDRSSVRRRRAAAGAFACAAALLAAAPHQGPAAAPRPGQAAPPPKGQAPPASSKRADDSPAAPVPAEVVAEIRKIRALYDEGRYAEAARSGEALCKVHKESAEAWLTLAAVHLSPVWTRRRDARAESASRRALQAGGRRSETLQSLATALYRQAKYDEAEPILNELIDPKPPRVSGDALGDLYVLRASIALRRDALAPGGRERAVADLEAALAAVPDHPTAHTLRAQMLIAEGKLNEALPHLELAAKSDPGDKAVHHQYHLCLSRLGRRDEAKRHYEIWHLLNRLTDSNSATSAPDPKEKREILAKLRECNPTDWQRRLDLIEAQLELGEVEAARKESDALLAERPAWPPALRLKEVAQKAKVGEAVPAPDDGGGG
jgi:tetratricopeptide (TPR) repeat protein